MYSVLVGMSAAIVLISALGVVSTKNIVHAAIYLLITLLGVSVIFLLEFAEFLALVQILVYAGAITIVLLFAVMLTRDIDQKDMENNSNRAWMALITFGIFIVFTLSIWYQNWSITEIVYDAPNSFRLLATALFSEFLVPFEIASLVLLVALIGAVVLTKEGRDGA
jgi:NADH-quinone oxidoreductase subunit J